MHISNNCPRGYVEKLILENFKSYAGRHEIGPFKRFSCIIGPNGSGKSNVMDALSFVLGIQAKHLRGERLIDLVYRREEESVDNLERSAMVMIVFVMPGGVQRMHVGRIINSKGESQYKFGVGNPPKLKNIDFEGLQTQLKTVNIYVRARNFLVFQGDVMDLARRQGQELTRIIETISGSDALKAEMEKLETEKRIAEERQRVFFAQKRQTDQLKTELEREKSDLEQYHRLKEKSNRAKLESYLFGLYAQELQIESAKKELEKVQILLKEKTEIFEEKNKASEDVAWVRKKLVSQVVQFENAFRRIQAESNEQRCEKETLMRQQHNFAKNVKDVQNKRDELVYGLKQKQEFVEATKRDLELAKRELEVLKMDIKEKDKDIFTKEQQKLWNEAEVRARALTSQKKREFDDKSEQLTELRSARKDMDRRRAELQLHQDEIKKRLLLNRRHAEMHSKDIDATHVNLSRAETDLAPLENEVSELKKALQSFIDEKKTIERNLSDLKEQRQFQSATRAQRDIVGELRSNFPGVVERVNELIIPSSVTGRNALAAALGGNQHFVVCDTVQTARQCCAHLKKNKRDPLTFMPMESIRPNFIKGLHVLVRKNGRKLATGICKPNQGFYDSVAGKVFEPKLQSITETILNATLGDCIVCEKLDDARSISYTEARSHNLRCRVVTLDGDMIRVNGNMVSADNRNANFGQKTSQQEEVKLREAVKAINEDIEETTAGITELSYKIDVLKTNIKASKETIRHGGGRTNVSAEGFKKDEENLKKIVKELDMLDSKLTQQDEKIKDQEAVVAAVERKMLELGKHFYEEISKQMKVPNIRVLIAERKKEVSAKHAQLNELEEMTIQLQTDITRTKAYIRDDEAQVKRFSEDLKKKEKLLVQAQDNFEKGEKNVEKMEAQLLEKRKEHRETKHQLEMSENKMKELKNEVQKAKAEMTLAQNQERKTNKVRSITHAKYKDLEASHMDGVLIPTLECPSQYKESEEGAVGGRLFEEERSADQIEEVLTQIKIDYSLLNAESKDVAATSCEDAHREVKEKYKAELDDLQKKIQALPQSLNLNAQREYAELCEKFRDQTEEAEQMVKTSQHLQRTYEAVKDERYEKFMSCFREVEKEVDPIYKELTTFEGREGGSAFLDLECPDEPFAGGTLFTACPPGKRFFDMSLLSGGEKSMASMALLLAMHSHNPPPFMILDEVDAPFDRKNTDALVAFLKKMPFQSIVISLKDKFFCHADSCIGIYKDKQLQTSGSLTIELADDSDGEV
eukprot:GEMP01003546.1.p1 GENE.GEMP01003546.1~~GEMP01003546.1.p1  ORF type:complete len:1264 (+),score=303.90 GEMP01003546.1:177-3968(+)